MPEPFHIESCAMRAADSLGRRYPEPHHAYRPDYARDRDRIIHSRAFRRLEAKTQVFTRRFSDHFRNRLTHTLEVSQIARTVAEALGLNTRLAEALALVHDIGHPPFGHAGERKLNELMRLHGASFDHNLHALRIVEHFEQRYLAFPGLNLTFEVREGIIKHSRDYSVAEFPQLAEYLLDKRPPLEAQLIDLTDEIAYNTADLDDAFEARLLDVAELCAEVPVFARALASIGKQYPGGRKRLKFNEALRTVIDASVSDLIATTAANVRAAGARSVPDVRSAPRRLAAFSPACAEDNATLKRFLLGHIYNHPLIADERNASVQCLEQLFNHYLSSPGSMPAAYEQMTVATPRHTVVCDYVAGMTDHFLLKMHAEQFGESAPSQRQLT